MTQFSLEQLKNQGLDHFSAIFDNHADKVFIYLHAKKRFGRNEHRHVRDYAQRFLCPACSLKTNGGPIKCTGVRESKYNPVADIKSETVLPEAYWQALLARILCQPIDEWKDKRG